MAYLRVSDKEITPIDKFVGERINGNGKEIKRLEEKLQAMF